MTRGWVLLRAGLGLDEEGLRGAVGGFFDDEAVAAVGEDLAAPWDVAEAGQDEASEGVLVARGIVVPTRSLTSEMGTRASMR